MANGGWHGTLEEWEAAEQPLPALDSLFEEFAADRSFQLSKNGKDWPERSLRKHMPLSSLLQVFRADLDRDAWKLWAVCSQDRGSERFWKNELIADDITGDELSASLGALLVQGYNRLINWNARPQDLEFAVTLTPSPFGNRLS